MEVVSDGVRFRDEDMMDPAGLSTPTSQIKSEWRQSGKAHVKNGKTFILFRPRRGELDYDGLVVVHDEVALFLEVGHVLFRRLEYPRSS